MAGVMAASSDAGFMSDALSRSSKQQRQFPSSSSARPRGPPSENVGAPSDDEGEGFADDQIPNRSRPRGARNVPKVEDTVGLMVQETFERFIERCASQNSCYPSLKRTADLPATASWKPQMPRERRHQVPSLQISTMSPRFMVCVDTSSRPFTSTMRIWPRGRMEVSPRVSSTHTTASSPFSLRPSTT